MTEPTQCPKCQSEAIYAEGGSSSQNWVCSECDYNWSLEATQASVATEDTSNQVKDAFGNVLQDGDSVTLIKDLKVKGAGSGIKVGQKVKGIRIVDGADGHNIACKIDGIGSLYLKSEFVKKA